MKKLIPFFLVATAFMVLFSDCKCNKSSKQVDVSNVDVTVKIDRFDRDFFAITEANYDAQTAQLQAKYGDFYPFYVNQLMGGFRNTEEQSASQKEAILKFLGNGAIRGLYDTVQKEYKDVSDVEQDLTGLAKHFKYYFPNLPAPKVITMISEFSYGAITYDSNTLAISLDMFLTEKYPVYNFLEIPKYVQRKLNRDYIAPNASDVLYNLHFGDDVYEPGTPLIEAMVEKGKQLYFKEMMLPDAPDSLLIGYSGEQIRWCNISEYVVWQYLNEKDLLYSQSFMEHKRYLTDGPTTTGMPKESPGNMGSWVGWQIVRKFMKDANGKISLNDLLTKYDAKTIVAKANYRPQK